MSTSSSRSQWPTSLGAALVVAGAILMLIMLLILTTIQAEAITTELYAADFSHVPSVSWDALKNIKCPAAIAPTGTGDITYTIHNPTDSTAGVRIIVFATAPQGMQSRARVQCDHRETFDAYETRTFSCQVSATNIEGNILIIDVPGFSARCGVPIIEGPIGLEGLSAVRAGFGLGLLLIIGGGWLWFLRHRPDSRFAWLRATVGGFVIASALGGVGSLTLATNAYWRLLASLVSFWLILALAVILFILLIVEGILMHRAGRTSPSVPTAVNGE